MKPHHMVAQWCITFPNDTKKNKIQYQFNFTHQLICIYNYILVINITTIESNDQLNKTCLRVYLRSNEKKILNKNNANTWRSYTTLCRPNTRPCIALMNETIQHKHYPSYKTVQTPLWMIVLHITNTYNRQGLQL